MTESIETYNGREICGICGTCRDLTNRLACRREHPQAEQFGFDRECDERAILKLRGEVSGLKQELAQYRSQLGENVTITLSGYERANLLWYIGLIGYESAPLEPFSFCNTGDWVGQISQKVSGEKPPEHKANRERDWIERSVAQWASCCGVER